MQETKGKRACRQGVWGSARLWERSWAARHTEDVRGDLRLHTIGQKEGKIHHYLDTSKDNCNSRCTGRISKSSSLKKDDWEFTLPCSPTPWMHQAWELPMYKCYCKGAVQYTTCLTCSIAWFSSCCLFIQQLHVVYTNIKCKIILVQYDTVIFRKNNKCSTSLITSTPIIRR